MSDEKLLKSIRENLEYSQEELVDSYEEGENIDDVDEGMVKDTLKDLGQHTLDQLKDRLKDAISRKVQQIGTPKRKSPDINKESVMSEYDNTYLDEAGKETPTLDTKNEEDPKLYQDTEGKHAKIDTDKGTEGKDKKNKSSIAGKAKGPSSFETPTASGTPQERLESTMTALFDGEELSEGFQTKAATIFEAAINERVAEVESSLLEQYESILAENIENVSAELAEKLDDYLGYVVEQWMQENQLSVEQGIRMEVAENFISGLKVLFENSYVDVPEEKYDLVSEIAEAKEELEQDLNKTMQENIQLRKEILTHRCGEIFVEQSDGLTDVEVEKLASLTEGIEFDSEDQYRDKIAVLRESYFTNSPILTEEVETTNQVISEGGPMDRYTNTISRHSSYNKVS